MAPPRFHHPKLTEGRITLSEAESAHARRSRRLRPGDAVVLFDGAGRLATGQITHTPPGEPVAVAVEHIERIPDDKPRVILATALPKGPRQDYLIEKCTELGVNTFRPVIFDRSVVKPRGPKVEKFRRTAIEAAKQSGRAWLPDVEPPTTLEQIIAEIHQVQRAYYAHDSPQATALITLLERDQPTDSLLIAIGPEGGFTEGEVSDMREAGLTPATLGPHILRIETAATSAAAVVAAWRQTRPRT